MFSVFFRYVCEVTNNLCSGLLPGHFDHFFKSVTFTNGGMKYSLINFRFSQTLGGSRLFGSYFVKLSSRYRLSPLLSTRQLRSVWGPNANSVERDEDIAYIAELIQYKGGNLLMNKLMYYLWDRAHFEFRWFSALREIDIPIRFVWADSDAVSPVAIPQYFQSFVPGMTLTLVKDAGHFFVLEKPGKWMEVVIKPLISSWRSYKRFKATGSQYVSYDKFRCDLLFTQ